MNPNDPSKVQGEGDYASARKYNERARTFADSGKVEEAAERAAPQTPEEQEAMRRAEAEGRSHAKGQPSPAGKVVPGTGKKPDPDKSHPEGSNPEPEKIPGR